MRRPLADPMGGGRGIGSLKDGSGSIPCFRTRPLVRPRGQMVRVSWESTPRTQLRKLERLGCEATSPLVSE